ncbi:hypothetical protein HPB47_021840 [Ixodes persulcatus]|uniref:Uncharacterized protein n=1 Tax=Ixodes persulcatus TaxID=34615 RepID=A0AC60QDL6_IXOPE|nr:hypothetical protein HPB47_021840 [Ixodes persulcatus]
MVSTSFYACQANRQKDARPQTCIVDYFRDNDLKPLTSDKEGGFVVSPGGEHVCDGCSAVYPRGALFRVVVFYECGCRTNVCSYLATGSATHVVRARLFWPSPPASLAREQTPPAPLGCCGCHAGPAEVKGNEAGIICNHIVIAATARQRMGRQQSTIKNDVTSPPNNIYQAAHTHDIWAAPGEGRTQSSGVHSTVITSPF